MKAQLLRYPERTLARVVSMLDPATGYCPVSMVLQLQPGFGERTLLRTLKAPMEEGVDKPVCICGDCCQPLLPQPVLHVQAACFSIDSRKRGLGLFVPLTFCRLDQFVIPKFSMHV